MRWSFEANWYNIGWASRRVRSGCVMPDRRGGKGRWMSDEENTDRLRESPALKDGDARLLFDGWKEYQSVLLAGINFRWDVTKSFLTAMAAVIAGALVLSGKMEYSRGLLGLSIVCGALTIIAYAVHVRWQVVNRGYLLRLQKRYEVLDAWVHRRFTQLTGPADLGDGAHPYEVILTAIDEKRGFWAIVLVTGAIAAAAAVLVLAAPHWRNASDGAASAQAGPSGSAR
jgi:hypothetical protein